MERMTPMKKSLKKTICVVLCALILFCSFVFVGSAESVDHPSGCQCVECVGTKDPSDLTYVAPSDETTKKSGVDDFVSEVIGTNLDGKEDEIYESMSVFQKLLERLRDFCAMLARFADELSEPLKNFFDSRA